MLIETIYYFEILEEKPSQFAPDKPKKLPRYGDDAMQGLVNRISKAFKIWTGKIN